MKVVMLKVKSLKLMDTNPRFIKDANFDKLKLSIVRDPEFLLQRPILVNRTSEGDFIYAGNQRYRACLELSYDEVPCMVDENLSPEILKDRTVKDNVHYGQWDEEKLRDFEKEDLDFLALNFDAKMDIPGIMASTQATSTKEHKDKMELRQDDHDATEREQSMTQGKHEFVLLFDSEDQKKQFELTARKFTEKQGDERFEHALSKVIKQDFNLE